MDIIAREKISQGLTKYWDGLSKEEKAERCSHFKNNAGRKRAEWEKERISQGCKGKKKMGNLKVYKCNIPGYEDREFIGQDDVKKTLGITQGQFNKRMLKGIIYTIGKLKDIHPEMVEEA